MLLNLFIKFWTTFFISNKAVAIYNVDLSSMNVDAKRGPSSCRSFAHELFQTNLGIDRLNLQTEIGKPVLKASCSYRNPR